MYLKSRISTSITSVSAAVPFSPASLPVTFCPTPPFTTSAGVDTGVPEFSLSVHPAIKITPITIRKTIIALFVLFPPKPHYYTN
jgi:hypothetical protein